MTKEQFIMEMSKLGINLSNKQIEQFEQYYEMIINWNQKFNLTGITEKEQVYLKHFYDSATLVKVIDLNKYKNICDVGTGAGFPGVVIKIIFPNINVTLLDSLNKRLEFLKEVIKELDLNGIETVHSRIEDFSKINREKYDLVTARAVAPLNILLETCIPILKTNGYFLPLKANISQEIKTAQNVLKILNCSVESEEEFFLPIENSIRTILKIKKNKATNIRYPRNNNEINKRPL